MSGHKKKRCIVRKTTEFPDGTYYSGSWYDDKPSGYGRMEYPNGTVYTGWFLSGKRNGHGIHVSAIGVVMYDGEWENDQYNGNGSLFYPDEAVQTVYKGSFSDGKYHGTGTLLKKENDWYSGEWYRGVRHGRGKMVTPDYIYDGEYCYNLRSGNGIMIYADGSMYNGSWRQDLRCGTGVLTSDDDVYTGAWKHGKKHGHGRWISKEGSYDGRWKNGLRHFKGVHNYMNGDVYSGGWRKGVQTGHGTMKYADGTDYVGFWSNNKRQGRGQWSTKDSVFVGVWDDDERFGMCTETFTDGTKSTGPWLHDSRHGAFEITQKNNKSERKLYIWGVEKHFESKKKVRKYVIQLLNKSDMLAAEEVLAFYPKVLTWKLLAEYDKKGKLVHMMNKTEVLRKCRKHGWKLFKEKKYTFIEQCVRKCSDSEIDHLTSELPVLFDAVTHDFVANPWVVGQVSYSSSTRKRLLEGLHLGEIGRCPPKDPFTRCELSESSGVYLDQSKKRAKTVYKTFINILGETSSISDLAFEFNLQDYEIMISNARDARDHNTLRRLMAERNAFIKSRRSESDL